MNYIDEVEIHDKRVLVRADFNISFNAKHEIANDARIRESLPTIEYLLKNGNKLILISHLGRPHGVDKQFSLAPVAQRLQHYLPQQKIMLVSDLSALPRKNTQTATTNEIFLLENIRFFAGEEKNDPQFVKELASFGDVFVNDAFSVSHRKTASIIGLPAVLPSFAGLLMKKEISMLTKAISSPHHPFVTVLGGAKISTKIKLIEKLIALADIVLLGGGLATTFLLALGMEIGRSLAEPAEQTEAKRLLQLAEYKQTRLVLPIDVVVGDRGGKHLSFKQVQEVNKHDTILDIGPQTIALFEQSIAQARTLIWNGPVGLFEVDAYKHGTDAIYKAITSNTDLISIVGGGETLAALSHKHHLEKITHISTGGGAMLEFIEKGTLPGIEALNPSPRNP